jgi:pimeloyl-ACP methyl ester carboxylesterase
MGADAREGQAPAVVAPAVVTCDAAHAQTRAVRRDGLRHRPHFMTASVSFRPGRIIRVRGVDINCEFDGPDPGTAGLSAVLIHGFGASLQCWSRVAPMLGRWYPIVRLDLRGFGFSAQPRDELYTLEEQAAIVADAMKALSLRRVVLAGHSYGGAVACLTCLRLQRDADCRIAGLVLIDAASYPQRLPFFVSHLRHPFARHVAGLMPATWRALYVLRQIVCDRSQVDGDMVERYAFFMRRPGADYAFARVAQQIGAWEERGIGDAVKAIDLPTLIIWGDEDPSIPVEFAHRLHRDIRGSELHVFPRVGHLPHEERPQETASLILNFLSKRS